jgi:spore maturation protein CgeB
VRYPASAIAELANHGISYCGWLPNHRAPGAFATSRFTVHVPRQPYAESLRGIPTIRVFEALACGIPLVCAPWEDSEGLFPKDCYLMAASGSEMQKCMRELANSLDLRETLRTNGLAVIAARHTCRHRAEQLVDIYSSLQSGYTEEAA